MRRKVSPQGNAKDRHPRQTSKDCKGAGIPMIVAGPGRVGMGSDLLYHP
jgi:hypothetical protein